MSLHTKFPSTAKFSTHEKTRPILGPGGNTFISSDHKSKGIKKDTVKKIGYNKSDADDDKFYKETLDKANTETLESSVLDDTSVESLCSSDSSSMNGSSAKKSATSSIRIKRNGTGLRTTAVKRCHWITPHSDQVYITFHDEEWGVPVHDDNKLFELLVFSQALAELSWPAILLKRDTFRKHFDDFDAELVSKFTDAKLISLETLLSKLKVEAVVENAKQIVKVQQEFGSFNNYCWNFVNHRPIRNSIRYGNQMPAKSPKALVISKDMTRRGFRCVGPTVIYCFMEVAGIVNDHLVSCFRYEECTTKNMKIHALEEEETVSYDYNEVKLVRLTSNQSDISN